MANWVRTTNLENVERGVRGRFMPASGNLPSLRHMARGDWVIIYSPKSADDGGERIQAFTAIGQVTDDAPYQVEHAPDGQWRRGVAYVRSTAAPVRPLIEQLHFIPDKRRWGFQFRFGLFRIDDHDFALIKSAMSP